MKIEIILIFTLIALNWILTIILVAMVIRLSIQVERLKWQPFPKVSDKGKERKNALTTAEEAVQKRVRQYKNVVGINAKVVDSAEDKESGIEGEDSSHATDAARTNKKNRKAVREPEGKTSADDV